MNKARLGWFMAFFGSLYFFIVSIELIKEGGLALGAGWLDFMIKLGDSPLKALASGWLSSAAIQSGGTICASSAALVAAGALSLGTAIFIILGSRIGATITPNIISFLTKARTKKDFRHGFEIGAVNNIYNFINITILFIIEWLFSPLRHLGYSIQSSLKDIAFIKQVPDFIKTISRWAVEPAMKIEPKWLIVLIGILVLACALAILARTTLKILGGRKKGKEVVHRWFRNKYQAFAIGLLITAIIPSTNITISLLVPLAVLGLINIFEAIPYIIGANIGTVTEVILAAFVTGEPSAIATALVYASIPIVCAIIWLPNQAMLFKITKCVTKYGLKIRKPTAVAYLIFFLAIPLLILLS